MRVAFLGHDQSADAKPTGGYISKSEAEALVRLLAAERISQKRIRAFPPETAFHCIHPETPIGTIMGSGEIPGLRFVGPKNPLPRFISAVGPDSGWDWSQEPQREAIPA